MPGHVKKSEGPDPDPAPWLFVTREMKVKDLAKPYDAKTDCWVPHPEEGYAIGKIKGTKGDFVTVEVAGASKDYKKAVVAQVNPPKYEKCEDMSNLTFLNDASVLYNLKTRYQAQLIYTYSGLFCIAVNPYKRFPIYTDRACAIYTGKRRNEVPPHLFAISDGAYQNMVTLKDNQSMLITGESGAGKTENTKKVISYFAFVGATGDKPKPGEDKKSLEDQIVSTNPVLEAFGNAKTTRNDNSSRFGKFIRIHFQPSGKLSGADIENYLLEKARVVSQASAERSYHIFYNIMTGYVPWLKEKCHLSDDIYDYKWQSQGKVTVASIDDKEDMEFAHIAFNTLLFTDLERENIYKVTAVTMHSCNLKFKQRGREEQAEPDDEFVEHGNIVAELLGVDAEMMFTNFCKPKIKVGNEIVTKGQNVEKTIDQVAGMAKGFFDRLFSFLVIKCNETLETGLKRAHFIGVLDIAGFEIFDFNGFEQISINFTNEKLQQFFNHHMFVEEQEEYKREGIQWNFVDFGMDLQATITLFEMKMGIWSILEEESMFPKATDKTFQEKLVANHEGKSAPFLKPKGNSHFGIQHYAGVVHYNITGWLEKNKDPLNDTVVDQLKKGSNELVVRLFSNHPGQSEPEDKKGGKKKTAGFKTVCSAYRDQLNSLMAVLNSTHPHFIRCIVPNEVKTPGKVEAALIMHQLTCNGVLEGIRICKIGLPNRMVYSDFYGRYKILGAQEFNQIPDKKKAVQAVFGKLGIDSEKFRVGATKVFFRAGVLGEVEEIRDDRLGMMVSLLQAWVRGRKSRKWYAKLKSQRINLIVVQRNLKKYMTIRTWLWYGLWQQLKPTLNVGREAQLLVELEEAAEKAETNVVIANEKNIKFTSKNEVLLTEKNALLDALESSKGGVSDFMDKEAKLMGQKQEVEQQLIEAQKRLENEQQAKVALQQGVKKTEQEVDSLGKDLKNGGTVGPPNKQKQKKKIREEIAHQEELIAKVNKEKKHLNEANQKTSEDHQGIEDKCNHLNRVKSKLEQQLDELEDSLEREKKLRSDVEKTKRKTEGDLRLTQEAVADLERNQKELENTLARKDNEVAALSSKIDDEALGTARTGKQAKELLARIEELEDELKSENSARAKAEKAKQMHNRELEEIGDRLDEAGGATAAQVELNKKREGELAKLRRDLEENNLQHEAILSSLRKKHNDAVAEMSEQIDYLNKMKARSEKDKETMRMEADDAKAAMDGLARDKAASEKTTKQMQHNLAEMQARLDEANRTLNDFDATKKKLAVENEDLIRQLEEAENHFGTLSKLKLSLTNQLEDAKKMADDESRERATLLGKFRNLEHDIQGLREKLDEEADAKADIHRQLSRANAEAQMYRAKYESEGVARAEELEAARQKLQSRLDEAEQQIDQLNFKNAGLEKAKNRLTADLEQMHIDCERATTHASAAEKKQKNFDKIIQEWKLKVDDLAAEFDASQKECRNYSTELFRVKACYEENVEALDSVRRENKNLSDEIKDLMDQIGEGGRNYHEVSKNVKKLDIEKEELQAALEEAEAALEQEENKVLRGQLELSQLRQEIDRRIAEKEEEFDNTRKTHQRAIESMQASLEAESKGKADALRAKKKLESDINELEISLDHANKANSDLQKHLKKLHSDVKDLQDRVTEQQRIASEFREQYGIAERRANALNSELEESRTLLEQSDRSRRQAEADLADGHEQVQNMSSANGLLTVSKRKLEGDMQTLHADLDEMLNEAKHSEEKAKKAMVDAARLADELRSEQEHCQNVEKMRKNLDVQARDLQLKLEESEANAAKTGKAALAKLEHRVAELEAGVNDETTRHADALKNVRRCERRIKELTFQSEEDKKNHDRMQDLVDKLQQKLKTYKRQIEEAEEIAALNLAKFRKAQQELEVVEEQHGYLVHG
ncbi:unnamed protein product [Meganyctiphanes norvegica]|uniref:Myosin heavy chain n=1 Tax=Meganyctiphanes norvegica TaxID=48144 RepID=A0AAV2Q6L5_MEGNR